MMHVNACVDKGRQLVFDTNILVDALTARGTYYEDTVTLLERVRDGQMEGWYAPHTITTVYYLLERILSKDAASRAEATRAARELLRTVLGFLKPLPQVGDELLDIVAEDGDDLEDLIIVKLAMDYLPNPIFITRDKWFLKRDGIVAFHPKEFVEQRVDLVQEASQPIDFIDLKAQQRAIRPQLEKNIHQVLAHGRYIMGPEVAQLETRLAEFVGVKHCIAVSSGTDSLLIAMMALGIGPGDEVITTPFTFIATGEMIALLGAKPVFVDIDPLTCNIDATKIEAAITPRTKAIMPVSLFGQCADMDAIQVIADQHALPIIEDGAQSFGAIYKGRKSCGLSTIGSTSFFPSKPLGCYGDGGALFTQDDDLAKAMREIHVHGQDRRYHHPRIGVNGRIDALQAAVVLAKLDRFEWEITERQKVAARYMQLFKEEAGDVQLPHINPDHTSVFAQFTVQSDQREAQLAKLKAQHIPTAVHYPVPLHLQPAFAPFGYQQGDLPNAERCAQRVFSLPMGPDLSEAHQRRIVDALAHE